MVVVVVGCCCCCCCFRAPPPLPFGRMQADIHSCEGPLLFCLFPWRPLAFLVGLCIASDWWEIERLIPLRSPNGKRQKTNVTHKRIAKKETIPNLTAMISCVRGSYVIHRILAPYNIHTFMKPCGRWWKEQETQPQQRKLSAWSAQLHALSACRFTTCIGETACTAKQRVLEHKYQARNISTTTKKNKIKSLRYTQENVLVKGSSPPPSLGVMAP